MQHRQNLLSVVVRECQRKEQRASTQEDGEASNRCFHAGGTEEKTGVRTTDESLESCEQIGVL